MTPQDAKKQLTEEVEAFLKQHPNEHGSKYWHEEFESYWAKHGPREALCRLYNELTDPDGPDFADGDPLVVLLRMIQVHL